MGIYRDKLDIIANILEVASTSAKKTQIMYKANLSYKILQKYLTETTGASLLDFHDLKQSYCITPKGLEFLQTYREYSKDSKSMEYAQSLVDDKRKALDELCSVKKCVDSLNKTGSVKEV